VGVRHLGGHEQFEIVIVVLDRIAKLDLLNATVCDELLLEEQRVDRRINLLLDVLNEDGLSIAYAASYITEEGVFLSLHEEPENRIVFLL